MEARPPTELDRTSKIAALSKRDHRAHLEWCRSFLDHHCIFRSPPGPALLTAYNGGRARWQLYMPVAILDQEFMRRIALLFWDRFYTEFKSRPFQLCGCESGGVPLVCALQAAAYANGFMVNAFEIKKAQKTYGLKNWLEGVVLPDQPVLLIDDVVGAGLTLRTQGARLREFGLELSGAFAIVAGNPSFPPPRRIRLGVDRVGAVETLFVPGDLAWAHEQYVTKYRKQPQFQGVTR